MKLLIQITLLVIFLGVHSSILAQINLCTEKEVEIKERAKKIVNDYIQLATFSEGDVDIQHEITDVSNIFYDYEQDFYFLKISTLRTIEGDYDKKSLNVIDIQNNPELDYILKIERIERLIPEIKTQAIGSEEEFSDLSAKEVEVVTCQQTIQPLEIDLVSGTVIKKGTGNTIEWVGGTKTDKLVIDLVKLDKKGDMKEITNLANDYVNTGYHPNWNLENNIKPGIYKIRIKKNNTYESPVWSEEFKIKSKFSTVLKVGIPLIAVGVVVYLLIPDDENENLPDPPTTPGR